MNWLVRHYHIHCVSGCTARSRQVHGGVTQGASPRSQVCMPGGGQGRRLAPWRRDPLSEQQHGQAACPQPPAPLPALAPAQAHCKQVHAACVAARWGSTLGGADAPHRWRTCGHDRHCEWCSPRSAQGYRLWDAHVCCGAWPTEPTAAPVPGPHPRRHPPLVTQHLPSLAAHKRVFATVGSTFFYSFATGLQASAPNSRGRAFDPPSNPACPLKLPSNELML